MKALIALVAVLGSLTMSRAQQFFFADLEPGSEVPPHSDSASGNARLTLDSSLLSVDIGTYQNMSSEPVYVTLFYGPPGANGLGFRSFQIDTPLETSGTFSGSVLLTPPEITELEAGEFYLNIPDMDFPDGDIRGQLEPAPEPLTVALFGVGTLALIAVRIRRRSLLSSNVQS